eukprot:m.260932 g.260932  ORF g.260932 m.260932 type:complete len:173 (-) comp40900_c0_seq1:71-589(-)
MPRPNILITGTPGTGKTSFATELADRLKLNHIDISAFAVKKKLISGVDEERNCPIIDEDKVCDELEGEEINISEGGVIVDYHGCDFFPERYFQLVVVLRTDNTTLWTRLEKRGYPVAKVQENVQAEIMQVVLEEARESYKQEIIQEMQNDNVEQMEENLTRIQAWFNAAAAS